MISVSRFSYQRKNLREKLRPAFHKRSIFLTRIHVFPIRYGFSIFFSIHSRLSVRAHASVRFLCRSVRSVNLRFRFGHVFCSLDRWIKKRGLRSAAAVFTSPAAQGEKIMRTNRFFFPACGLCAYRNEQPSFPMGKRKARRSC